MTTVTFLLRNGQLAGFDISGHTGLASAGNDILCAAISSAAYLTANTVTEVMCVKAEAEVSDGRMKLLVPAGEESKCRDMLKGLELHMKQLREQYPKRIRIINLTTREGA